MKKFLSVLLSVAMILSMFTVGAAAADYEDTAGHWAEEEIVSFSGLGIVEGYNGLFRPDADITRGEMAVILDRIMDYQVTAENQFTDLGEDYYTDALLKANASGIILGYDGQVRPLDTITRQEAAVMIVRALALEAEGGLNAFTDKADVADWAQESVAAMAALGYMQGYNDQVMPLKSITRAEVVALLDRAMVKLVDADETVSGDVNGNVVVRGAGATLSDMTITGNLIIAEGVAEGDVHMDNVTVDGQIVVRGGGVNSIYLNNVRTDGGVVVRKLDGQVRIVTTGDTKVSVSVLESGAILVGDGYETVLIPAEAAAGMEIQIDGSVERLENHNEDVTITAEGTIGTVAASADTEITGDVKISNTAGSATITLNDKVISDTSSGGGSAGTGGSGGSGGGGGGGTGGGESGGGETGGSGSAGSDDGTYTITLDTTSISLNPGKTHQLNATVTVPEGSANTVTWTSNNAAVATVDGNGLVTAVAAGGATITAKLLDTYAVSCDVSVIEAGWSGATNADSRFAPGYPVATTDANGNVVLKVKVEGASETNPVEVYALVVQANAGFEATVDSVLHGHAGDDTDPISVEQAPYLTITDEAEHAFTTHVEVTGDSNIDLHFVLKDSTGTSQAVTTLTYTAEQAAVVDQYPPHLMAAYINDDLNTIYLHLAGDVNYAVVPAASAFTLSGVEGATVTAVALEQAAGLSEYHQNEFGYVKLTVNGITATTDISSLEVTYTQPETNPIQDKAATPNKVATFTESVYSAGVSLEETNVRVSADGKYIYVRGTGSPYFPVDSEDFTVTVTGTEIGYKTNWTWHSNGGYFDLWLTATGETGLTAGDTVTITLTPGAGMIDYAMEPITQPLSVTGTAADSAIEMTSATYSTTTNRITVTFNSELGYGYPYGCCFTLTDPNGKEYVLRDDPYTEYNGDGRTLILPLDNSPAVPAADWTLTYKVLHTELWSYLIVTGLSGEPMGTQTLDNITITE